MASPEPQQVAGVEEDPVNNPDEDDDSEEEDPPELSGFDRIQKDYKDLQTLIKKIHDDFGKTPTVGAPPAGNSTSDANSNSGSGPAPAPAPSPAGLPPAGNSTSDANSNSNSGSGPAPAPSPSPAGLPPAPDTNAGRRTEKVRKDVKHIQKNVKYIIDNVKNLENSPYRDGAEELLRYLMDAAEKQTADDFPDDSDNLKHLLHIIAKLKHWVPPPSVNPQVSTNSKNKSNKEKKESPIVNKPEKDKAVADIVKTLVNYDCKDWGFNGLLKSYQQLKVRDKLCLLCFSAFLCDTKVQKKKKEAETRKEEEKHKTENEKEGEKQETVKVKEEEKPKTDQEEGKKQETVKEEENKKTEEEDKEKQKEVFLVQKNLVIKKKILIFWWVGEGFIQPISSSNQNPTTNPHLQNIPTPNSSDPITNTTSNQITSTNADLQGTPIPDLVQNSANQNHNPTTNPISNPDSSPNVDQQGNPIPIWPPPEDEGKTIEQIGENVLKVLREKGFIEPVMKRGRETGSYQMLPFVHAFVTALAKKAGFFDFSKVDGKPTYRFAVSQRACLVKSQGKLQSSCKIWKDAIENREALKKFATVQTLFNVNEAIIDIQPEWFSKMKHLSVLHLGSWRSEAGEHIEVEDPKFMDELKNMKQLKLFSLQGVATIMKLPDSVCKLSSLIILDLRECHNLEELPANIGELENLTHLDLTNCHLLTKLPKGVSLLSKLQVLNWFVIYNQGGEEEVQKGCMSKAWKKTKGFVVHDVFRYENKEVCTLKDLLKLGSLRELSIVVNRNKFPTEYEAGLLMEMRELCTLKISWVYDIEDNNETNGTEAGQEGQDSIEDNNNGTEAVQEGQESKCGSCFRSKKSEENTQVQDTCQKRFEKLEKLELWCFPEKNLPDWLVPKNLQKLKKLYIKGGKLQNLGADDEKWSVEMLRLKYLKELKIEWRKLTAKFPNMTYLEKFQCKQLGLFPCDHEGVWINKEMIANRAV